MKIKTKVQSLIEFLTNKRCENCKHNRGFGCHSSRGKECVLSIFPAGYEKQRITDGLIVEFSESKNKKLIAKQPSRWGLKSQKKVVLKDDD